MFEKKNLEKMKGVLFVLLIVFVVSSVCQQKNDEGASWLGTSFNPFTYEHGAPILDMGVFVDDSGLDFKKQKGVESIYDRHTSILQTFKEVTTISDYYVATEMDVEASGGFSIFSGSASFKESQTYNHSDLTQHRMFVGIVKETIRFLVTNYREKNLTKSWQTRFEELFYVLSNVKYTCPFVKLKDVFQNMSQWIGRCTSLRLSVSIMNEMLRETGWFVTGVKLGGSIIVRVMLDAEQVSTLSTKQISDGVSAKFGPFFSGSYSQSTTQETLNQVSTSVTLVEKFLKGGEGSFNDTQTDFVTWSKTIYTKPAVIGVKENILCDLITVERFTDVKIDVLSFVKNLCLTQLTTMVDMNTPVGCAVPNNKLFDPNVLKSGHCSLDTNFTFGGFVQTAALISQNDPNARYQPNVYASPVTEEKDRPLCPNGWYAKPVSSFVIPSIYEKQTCWHDSGGWFSSGHTFCRWNEIPFVCALNVSICVKDSTDEGKVLNKLAGGFYSSQQNNPLTGSQTCPEAFVAIPLLNNSTFSCEAVTGSVDEKLAVPFGGVYSGNSPNVFTGKFGCPHGHSRYYMGSFLGVPWYYCMAFVSPFEPRPFRYLSTLSDQTEMVMFKKFDQKTTINESQKGGAEILAAFFIVLFVIVSLACIFLWNARKRNLTAEDVWSASDKENIPLVSTLNKQKSCEV